MGVIAKYKFDSSLCTDFIPEFNSEFTGYTKTDVDNGDGTITRTISHDTLKPTLMRFGQRDETSYANLGSTALLEVMELDTSNITTMYDMFRGCTNLTSIICNWQTSNVTNMGCTFERCTSLTSLNVSNFNTSNVDNMGWMFSGCSSLTSLNVSNFNTSKVTTMSYMFNDCSSLTSLDVSSFNTSKVTNMQGMFSGCSSLTSLDISNFDTINVTNMENMFWRCSSLTSLNVSSFNTSNVTNMQGVFSDCSLLTSLDLSNFDTSKVTNMNSMFNGCNKLTSLDLSSFNTSSVTDMQEMFCRCSSLTSLDLSNFNTSSVTDMINMFWRCSSLTSLDLSSFNTSKVTNMQGMFSDCSSLTSLDISNFDTINVTDMGYIFNSCSVSNIGLLYASSSTINSLLTPLGTTTARNIYYLDADPSELTAQDNINYVEYKESVVKIPSEIVLRSLPNGIKDTLSLKTGRYVQRIKEVVLNGSENWVKATNKPENTAYEYRLDTTDIKLYAGLICNKLKHGGAENQAWLSTENAIYCGGRSKIIYITHVDIDNSNDFKQWLSQNPITVQYELENPVETYIDLQKLPLSYTNGKLELSAQSILPTLKYSVQTNKYEVPELLANTNYTIKSNKEQFIFDNYIQRGYTSNEITETDNNSTKVTLNATTVNSNGETVNDASVRVEDGEPEVLRIEGQTYQNLITESSETDYAVLDLDADIDAQTATINNTVQGNIHGVVLKGQTLVNLIDYSNSAYITKNNDTLTITSQNGEIWFNGNYRLKGVTYGKTYRVMWDSLTYTHTDRHGAEQLIGVYSSDSNNNQVVMAYNRNDNSNYFDFTVPSNAKIERVVIRIHATTFSGEQGATTTVKGLKVLEYQEGMENWDIPYFEGMQSVEVPSVKTTGKNLFDVDYIKTTTSSMSIESVENGVKIKANALGKYRFVYSRSFKVEKGEYYNITYTVENENPTNVANVTLKNLEGKDFSGFTDCAITGSGTVSKTFLAQDSGYVKPHLYASMKTDNGDYYVIYKNVMISKVSSSSIVNVEHEPYKSSTLTTPSDVVLRKVGDVQDELDLETGKLTQRIIEFNFNQDYINNVNAVTEFDNVYRFNIVKIKGLSNDYVYKSICDKFKIDTLYTGDYEHAYYWNEVFYFFIAKNKIEGTIDAFKTYITNNPIKFQTVMPMPTIKTVDLSIVDQDNNTLPTIQTQSTLTHVFTSSQGLIPNVLIPQLKYPTLIKPSTQYTVQLKSTTFNTENPLTINLGGTTMTVPSTKFTITTPSTLTSQNVIFTGENNVIGKVVVIEGNLINKSLPFFEGIKSSFEGESSIEIKTIGKNLLNTNDYYIRHSTQNVIKDGESFTFDTTGGWGGIGFNNIKLKPNTTYNFKFESNKNDVVGFKKITGQNNEGGKKKFNFTTDETGLITLTIETKIAINSVKISNIQLEEVTSATPYEPYKSTTTTLNITEPLRSLPNGVRDKVIFKDGVAKLVRRVGKAVLDGSESWSNSGFMNENLIEFQMKNSNNIASLGFCDKFVVMGSYERIAVANSTIYIRILKSKVNSLDEFKKYLNREPATIYYELVDPVVTEVNLTNYPFIYKDGHIFTNTDYPAKLVYKPKTAKYMLKTTGQNSTVKTFYADDPNIVLLEGNKLTCKIPTFQGLCSADFKGVNNCALSNSIVLRRLPDGTCDTFNALTGVITRNIEESIIAKCTSLHPYTDTRCKNTVFAIVGGKFNIHRDNSSKNLNIALSNKFQLYKGYAEGLVVTENAEYLYIDVQSNNTNATIYLQIKLDRLSSKSADAVTKWLTENPITLYYKLATPVYTSISDILKPQATPNGTIYLDTTNQSINPVFKYRMPTTNFYQLNMDSDSVYTVQSRGAYTLNGSTTNVSGSTTINSNSTIIDL